MPEPATAKSPFMRKGVLTTVLTVLTIVLNIRSLTAVRMSTPRQVAGDMKDFRSLRDFGSLRSGSHCLSGGLRTHSRRIQVAAIVRLSSNSSDH